MLCQDRKDGRMRVSKCMTAHSQPGALCQMIKAKIAANWRFADPANTADFTDAVLPAGAVEAFEKAGVGPAWRTSENQSSAYVKHVFCVRQLRPRPVFYAFHDGSRSGQRSRRCAPCEISLPLMSQRRPVAAAMLLSCADVRKGAGSVPLMYRTCVHGAIAAAVCSGGQGYVARLQHNQLDHSFSLPKFQPQRSCTKDVFSSSLQKATASQSSKLSSPQSFAAPQPRWSSLARDQVVVAPLTAEVRADLDPSL